MKNRSTELLCMNWWEKTKTLCPIWSQQIFSLLWLLYTVIISWRSTFVLSVQLYIHSRPFFLRTWTQKLFYSISSITEGRDERRDTTDRITFPANAVDDDQSAGVPAMAALNEPLIQWYVSLISSNDHERQIGAKCLASQTEKLLKSIPTWEWDTHTLLSL